MKNLYVILEKMTVHSLSNIKDLFANAIYDDLMFYVCISPMVTSVKVRYALSPILNMQLFEYLAGMTLLPFIRRSEEIE